MTDCLNSNKPEVKLVHLRLTRESEYFSTQERYRCLPKLCFSFLIVTWRGENWTTMFWSISPFWIPKVTPSVWCICLCYLYILSQQGDFLVSTFAVSGFTPLCHRKWQITPLHVWSLEICKIYQVFGQNGYVFFYRFDGARRNRNVFATILLPNTAGKLFPVDKKKVLW